MNLYIHIHAEYNLLFYYILLFPEKILSFINSYYLDLFTLAVRAFKILWGERIVGYERVVPFTIRTLEDNISGRSLTLLYAFVQEKNTSKFISNL